MAMKDKAGEKNSKSMVNLEVEDPDIKEYEEFRARQRLLNKHASPRVSFDDSPNLAKYLSPLRVVVWDEGSDRCYIQGILRFCSMFLFFRDLFFGFHF